MRWSLVWWSFSSAIFSLLILLKRRSEQKAEDIKARNLIHYPEYSIYTIWSASKIKNKPSNSTGGPFFPLSCLKFNKIPRQRDPAIKVSSVKLVKFYCGDNKLQKSQGIANQKRVAVSPEMLAPPIKFWSRSSTNLRVVDPPYFFLASLWPYRSSPRTS